MFVGAIIAFLGIILKDSFREVLKSNTSNIDTWLMSLFLGFYDSFIEKAKLIYIKIFVITCGVVILMFGVIIQYD